MSKENLAGRIKRRARRKTENAKGGSFPIRTAALDGVKGLNPRIPAVQPEFSLPV